MDLAEFFVVSLDKFNKVGYSWIVYWCFYSSIIIGLFLLIEYFSFAILIKTLKDEKHGYVIGRSSFRSNYKIYKNRNPVLFYLTLYSWIILACVFIVVGLVFFFGYGIEIITYDFTKMS